jgi:microcystin-dependent protein
MISMRYRDVLPPYVADEIDSLIGQIKAWALEEHDEEGHHIVNDRDLAFVSVGSTMGWLTATPPNGWAILQGQQLNRVTYKALFDLWGTTFGVGDGSTTFNVPDMRGRFFLSKAASSTGSVLGETGGAIDHTHSFGSHTHSISTEAAHSHGSGTLTGPSHTHSISSSVSDQKQVAASPHDHITPVGNNTTGDDVSSNSHTHGSGNTGSSGTGGVNGNTASGGSHDHGGATGSSSGGTSGTNNPPFLVGNTIVFTGVAA